MELISFLLLFSIGGLLLALSERSNSIILGIFSGFLFIMLGVGLLGNVTTTGMGLTNIQGYNETITVTNHTVVDYNYRDVFEGGSFTSTLFAVFVILIGVYLIINCALAWNDQSGNLNLKFW